MTTHQVFIYVFLIKFVSTCTSYLHIILQQSFIFYIIIYSLNMHIRYSTNYANVNVLNEDKRLKHKIVHFLIIGSKTKNLREKSTNSWTSLVSYWTVCTNWTILTPWDWRFKHKLLLFWCPGESISLNFTTNIVLGLS